MNNCITREDDALSALLSSFLKSKTNNTDFKSLCDKVEKMDAALTAVQNEIQTFQAQIQLKLSNVSLNAELEYKKKRLISVKEEWEKEKDNVNTMRETNTALVNKLADIESKYHIALADLADKSTKIEGLEKERSRVLTDLSGKSTRIEELETEKMAIENKLAGKEEEYKRALEDIDNKNAVIDQLESENKELKNKLSTQDSVNSLLLQTYVNLKNLQYPNRYIQLHSYEAFILSSKDNLENVFDEAKASVKSSGSADKFDPYIDACVAVHNAASTSLLARQNVKSGDNYSRSLHICIGGDPGDARPVNNILLQGVLDINNEPYSRMKALVTVQN